MLSPQSLWIMKIPTIAQEIQTVFCSSYLNARGTASRPPNISNNDFWTKKQYNPVCKQTYNNFTGKEFGMFVRNPNFFIFFCVVEKMRKENS